MGFYLNFVFFFLINYSLLRAAEFSEGQLGCSDFFGKPPHITEVNWGRTFVDIKKPPKLLYRVSRGTPMFSPDGFLMPHNPSQGIKNYTLPMVGNQKDLKFIEKFLRKGKPQSDYYRLEIDPTKVLNLKASKHPDFRGLEFFGAVHSKAIISIEPAF